MAKDEKKYKAETADPMDKAARKEAKAARKAAKKEAKGKKPGKDKKARKGAGFRQATTSLTCNDLEKSLRFYQALGFATDEAFKDDAGIIRGYLLRAGKTELMIGQDDFAKGHDRKKGVGLRIYLQTKASIDELAADAKAQGLTLESEPADQSWGSRTFDLTDPDGFKITVASAW